MKSSLLINFLNYRQNVILVGQRWKNEASILIANYWIISISNIKNVRVDLDWFCRLKSYQF